MVFSVSLYLWVESVGDAIMVSGAMIELCYL
jgi:hypothetical protein